MKDILGFIGVDPDFIPDSNLRHNMSGEIKNETYQKLTKLVFSHPNPIRWLSRKLITKNARLKFTTWVRLKNLRQQKKPVEIRRQLLDEYRDEILKLEDLIDRDLSHWLA